MSKAAELAALIGSQSALSNRNMIINGSMAISQRGTSSTGQGASDLFLVDRFHLNTNGNSAGRFTVTQESDGPSGIPNSLKLACTTADTSIAASERFFIEQRLEGQNLQRIKKGTSDAQAITVSFYVKGNASATYVVGIYDSDNSRQIGAQFSVTTSWNRVSVTFPADTGGSALDDDNAESLSLRFYLHAGSTYTGGTLQTTWDTAVNNEQVGSGTTSVFDSTSRTFFLTGVQLEVGETATPFEHEPYGVTLQKAQRYYLSVKNQTNYAPIGVGRAWSGTNGNAAYYFPCEMRSNPTVSVASLSKFDIVPSGGNPTAVQNDGGNLQSVKVGFQQTAGITNGAFYQFEFGNNTDGDLRFDAEL
jgi:hypothetical protein